MPWQQINEEVHSEALQISLKSKMHTWEKSSTTSIIYTHQSINKQQPFRAITHDKSPCFSFNDNAGNCLRTNWISPYLSYLQGQHHKRCVLSKVESNHVELDHYQQLRTMSARPQQRLRNNYSDVVTPIKVEALNL